MAGKTKLELTWIGKNKKEKLEPRVLIEDETKGRSAADHGGMLGIQENMLIKGDNLLALKALAADERFRGQVQCVYLDPPFNTGAAFEHYDDGLEHSVWLRLMRDRLDLIRSLMKLSGGIGVQVDDTEVHYLKVLMDEVFGRKNYITTVTTESSTSSSFRTVNLGPTQVTNYILLYARDKDHLLYNPTYIGSDEVDLSHFSRFIENFEDDSKEWRFQSINSFILRGHGFDQASPNGQWSAAKKAWGVEKAQEKIREEANDFALKNAFRVFETKTLQKPSKWLRDHIARSRNSDEVIALPREALDTLYLYRGRQIYFLGKGLREIDGEEVISQPTTNLWTDIPTNNLQGEGGVSFPSGKKPEFLVRRVIQMFTQDRSDIVLDSFGGSGTTGAVAHKMGRRWIMVELGDHADTHIVPRMNNVIDGEDPAGVTEATGWKGGGGYHYFRLAPSLLEKDQWGQYVISKEHKPEMLAEAVCKLMGFTYAPSQDHFWRHGHSTENDFIYVTTQRLPHDTLRKLSHEVGEGRSLLVCCRAHDENTFDNLTVRKIPHAVMAKCEWGRDDYSLNIQGAPSEPITDEDLENNNVEAAE